MEGNPLNQGNDTPAKTDAAVKTEGRNNQRGLIVLLVTSVLLIAIVIGAAVYMFSPAPPPFTPPDSLDKLSEQYPELANILKDEKLGSEYKEFLLVYQTQGEDAAYKLAKERKLINDQDEVRLTLELDTSDPDIVKTLVEGLEKSGIRVTASAGNLVDLAIPLKVLIPVLESGGEPEILMDLSGLEHVVRIRLPSTIQGKHVPSSQLYVEIESLSAIGADSWHSQGFTGQGVKVGILDLEYDGYRSLLGSELPESVTVECFCDGGQADQMGGVHGTAVAEIIHDIAPDAELFMAAFQTDAEFQQAAEWLASQGVQIISNSTGSNVGPKDGTSFSSDVIDDIVRKGILWVNSAGNAADGHYRAEFTDRDGDGWHDELIYFETFGDDSLALNWNAWATGDQDYDLFIYDTQDNLVASSQDAQTGTFSPSAEFVRFEAAEDGQRYYAAIQASRTSGNYVLDFFTNNGTIDQNLVAKEYSLDDEATSKLGLSIGAVYWGDDKLESYSSQGPTNDGRLKPELSAPSVVSVESYGREGFNGTSAATPHVAGAAALILSAAPDFSVEQTKDYLFSHAVDLGDAGPDNKFGYGRLYLGEIPNAGVTEEVIPLDTPETGSTEVEVTSQPTSNPAVTQEVGLAIPTVTSAATATPKPVETSIDLGSSDALLVIAILGILACLGMAGLMIAVFLWMRISRKRKDNASGELPSKNMGQKQQVDQFAPAAVAPPESPKEAAQVDATRVECPNCGRQNRIEAKFCNNCGYKLHN